MTQMDLFHIPAVPLGFQLSGLSQAEQKILAILLQHRGRESALDGRQLALCAEIGGSARNVRRIVSTLRRKHGIAVCSSLRRGSSGYYLADSADELKEATAWLVRLGLKILTAAARMKKQTLAEFMGQLRLDDWLAAEGDGEEDAEQDQSN